MGEVVMTRDTDKKVSLDDRVDFANKVDEDNSDVTFISIHANSYHESSANGVETFYYRTTDASDNIA